MQLLKWPDSMTAEVRLLHADNTDLLKQVIELADDNRNSLGFMPAQAFGPFAKSGNIIVALQDNNLLGYILFRRVKTKYSAAITHLCVSEAARGKRIPEQLFDCLKKVVKGVSAITLKCRRDYKHANRLWNRLGFVPRDEVTGRSLDGKPLTRWYYLSNNQLELFGEKEDDDKLRVVIDANVFYDLCNAKDATSPKESHSLLADWLLDDISLCVTDEIYHEINRNQNRAIREANRKEVRKFEERRYDKTNRDNILTDIKNIIKRSESERNNSDLTHLANAIAAKARYFITQDVAVIEEGEVLFDKYGLLVRRPVDLVVDIDELKNNNKYVESRFVEHKTSFAPIKAENITLIAQAFVSHEGREKLNDLRAKLRTFVATPERYHAEVWKANRSEVVQHAVIVWRVEDRGLDVSLLRCKSNHSRLAERKIKELILDASNQGLNYVRVSDQYVSDTVRKALTEYNFFRDSSDDCWYRFLSSGIVSVADMKKLVGDDLSSAGGLLEPLNQVFVKGETDTISLFNAEKCLWPVKLDGAKVPCYIVPIQHRWARNLFDERMSEADIFGFDSTLLFSRRNVYYRAASPRLPKEGRILWYVSKSKGGKEYGEIRAASYVEGVTISSAKSLFRKYEGLGIYKWCDIKSLAKGDANASIMCFEFADTELLTKPMSFGDVQKILVAHNRKPNQIVSPVEISHELYMKIYAETC
ncbi:MAG TPA: GNAT family N-acetyltransferase [Hymenobacter sp.]